MSGRKEGDIIAIFHLGIENGKTKVFKRDKNDRIIGKRNNWKIEVFDHMIHKNKSVAFEYDKETKA